MSDTGQPVINRTVCHAGLSLVSEEDRHRGHVAMLQGKVKDIGE
jgi:hypothetical protein